MTLPTIAFIGFGEAAQAFTQGWQRDGFSPAIRAYDLLLDAPAQAAAKRGDCEKYGVFAAPDAATAVAGAAIVISAVTADQVLRAAESVLPAMRPGQFFLDINSAAPFRKAAAAAPLVTRGVKAVDVAVMAPVHPRLHKTPLLIGGPGAAEAAVFLRALNMSFEVVSDRLGEASTIKMVRSIAIKGFESVVMECVVAAHALGVADRVLPTINDYLSARDFAGHANHMLERVVVHGRRRAAEMREVADTLEHAGLSHYLPAATAAHQQWVSDLRLGEHFGAKVPEDSRRIAEAVLAAIGLKQTDSAA